MSDLTRLVVVDENGRVYDRTNPEGITVSVQDDGQTLKVFVADPWKSEAAYFLQRAMERRD